MSEWRVIITDSETASGVAPVCDRQTEVDGPHDLGTDSLGQHHGMDLVGVYDCCPGPHIECFTEKAAGLIARALTEAEAEVCS